MKLYKYARIFELASSLKACTAYKFTPQEQKLHENKFGKQILLCSPNLYQTSRSFLSLQVTFAQRKYQPASHLG